MHHNTAGDSQEQMELQLWEYIDGLCSPEESTMVEKLVADNQQWRQKYQELLEVHQMIGSTDLEAPSMRFTKNVMEEISRLHIAPATKNYINNRVIWGIAIFFFSLIGGFLIYGFGQIDWSDTSSGNGLPDTLSRVDYSSFFNNTYINIFMMLNVVLGLMLLDRVLASRREKHYQSKA